MICYLKGGSWRHLECGKHLIDCRDDDMGLEFGQAECKGGKETIMPIIMMIIIFQKCILFPKTKFFYSI